jgi:uncharacterized protein (TIGR03067 family)
VTRLRIASLVLLFSLVSIALGEDPAKADKSRDGTWIPISGELGGDKWPEELTKSIKLVNKGDTYTVTFESPKGPSVDKGTIKSDTTKTPKTLDITGEDGPNKGKTFLAIYELKDDTLTICYDLEGKKRPTEFKTEKGTQQLLIVYKKQK